VRNIFHTIKDSNKLTVGINNNSIENKVLLEDGKSNNVKIKTIFNKGNDNGEILLPNTYNPNKVRENNDPSYMNTNEVISTNNNNPGRADSGIPASEIGFPSNPSQAVRRGDDILLTSPDRNIEDLTNSHPTEMERDFYLYDYPDSENSSFKTPSTMSPLFDNPHTPREQSYVNSIGSNRNRVESHLSYSSYVASTGASNYPVPLAIRSKVIKPSEM